MSGGPGKPRTVNVSEPVLIELARLKRQLHLRSAGDVVKFLVVTHRVSSDLHARRRAELKVAQGTADPDCELCAGAGRLGEFVCSCAL